MCAWPQHQPNPYPHPNPNPNPNPSPSPKQVAYPDFFWVFVTRTFYYMGLSIQARDGVRVRVRVRVRRTFYYMGLSIQAFVLFMLRDVQKVADPKYITSMLAMVRRRWGEHGQIAWADRMGR